MALNSDNNTGCAAEKPLLEGGEPPRKRWWKALDVAEAKSQLLFTLPMILTNVSYDLIPVVSVMFAGHVGEHELAASSLAISWASVSGFSLVAGLSGALETLCGQSYGAEMYNILGIYLQASCIISFFFSILISVIWWQSEHILILLLQHDHKKAKLAALFLRNLIPGVFAYGFLQNILRFLQAQSVLIPLAICSVLSLVIHTGINYSVMHWWGASFEGAALSASISMWIALVVLCIYVCHAKRFHNTWKGFSLESFGYMVKNLKLALPSAGMHCMEDWAFEALVLLSGMMPNSEITTSVVATCVNADAIAYTISLGLSATVSTRVSNELGRGNPGKAKKAMAATLAVSVILAIAADLAIGFGHNFWAGLFSDSTIIIREFSSLAPFLIVSITFEFIQGILSGVARGCGWQHLAVWIYLVTFYFIGMPIACVLGFKYKLYAKGLWIGLICGDVTQTLGLLMLTIFTRWDKVELIDPDTDKEQLTLV